jgi:hypothetical protein
MLGPSAAWLGPLLPELAGPPPPARPSPIADLGAARFQLNQAAAGLLRRLVEARPLLVVIDDLNWADVPSLSLLAFLAAELKDARLVVVGTYRDVELVAGRPLADTLGALAREPAVERISLGGLDRDGVAALIGRTIGARPAEPLVDAVADRCGGNPFFITELLRLLQSERRLAGPDAAAAARRDIPAGVRDVLRARLARLPAQTGTFLMVAAVAGRGFDLDLVEAVTGWRTRPRWMPPKRPCWPDWSSRTTGRQAGTGSRTRWCGRRSMRTSAGPAAPACTPGSSTRSWQCGAPSLSRRPRWPITAGRPPR